MLLQACSSPRGEHSVAGSLPVTATALVFLAKGVKMNPRQRCPRSLPCCWFPRYWCSWGRQQSLLVLLASPSHSLGMDVARSQACRFMSQGWSFAVAVFSRCEKIKQRKPCCNGFIHPSPSLFLACRDTTSIFLDLRSCVCCI